MSHTSLPPKIGVVSGICPLAGSDVFAKVLQHAAIQNGAVEDSEYPDLILVNHGIKGVDNTGTLNDAFEQEIVSMVKNLEEQGATIIGIACNTAHLYLSKIKVKPTTVLVNLVEQVAQEASKEHHNYLLLTSSTSKSQKLYHPYLKKGGVSFEETTQQQQMLLDEAIGLVMAHKLSQAGKILERVFLEASGDGFNAAIAGCTELPIAIDNCENLHKVKIVNSNNVLASSLVKKYYQKHLNRVGGSKVRRGLMK